MTNPYKILGVSPEASDEEIKLAYRELVHKYHPDKYVGTDLADMATEKMKEINAAYEEIQQMRKQQASGAGSDSRSKESSYSYQNESKNTSGAATFSRIRMHINSGELDDAEVLLRGISDEKHQKQTFTVYKARFSRDVIMVLQTCILWQISQKWQARFHPAFFFGLAEVNSCSIPRAFRHSTL